ncbi:MAG: 4Fe-4S binding protein [Oscillospiraceae bacterium]|jgi:iron only hydrogenase large subunit-like protein|nr:4Fe-4S binding protein [Oscillospiraceae bacterium]
MNDNNIFTNDKCVGCNLCILKCPCDEANVAYIKDQSFKVYVDHYKCIACGECLRICPHGARDYTDDTEHFFTDLKSGKKIPLLVAPALRSNIPEWPRLLGYLKTAGVSAVYDTSFGADICTWAYLRYISTNKTNGMIAQPCPAIVNYIEYYVPELLGRLAPIHSPAMCTAIYMSKYKNIEKPYAFLSPCVAKSDEFNCPNTDGLIGYNVTFKKLMEFLANNDVDFNKNEPTGYDNEAHGLGSIFSSPGGLKTNVEQYVDDRWIYQIEGQPHVSKFLHEYVTERSDVPYLIDILSCKHGCNAGTGACREEDEKYAIGKTMFKVQNEVMENSTETDIIPGPDFKEFDNKLELTDFKRQYTPRKIVPIFVDRYEVENAFIALHKPSHEYRTKDCRRCGFATCQEMAVAVAKGINHVENCIDYYRGVLKAQNLGKLPKSSGN